MSVGSPRRTPTARPDRHGHGQGENGFRPRVGRDLTARLSTPSGQFLRYAGRRIALLPLLLLAIMFVVFVMLEAVPGDPVTILLGQNATPETIARLEKELGLDRPMLLRFASFVGDALTGDLGQSYRTDRQVFDEIVRTGKVSLVLASTSMVVASVLGVGLGILSAVRPNGLLDTVLRIVVFAGVSMPVFWLGLLLIILFAVNLGWLPAFGWDSPKHFILPAVTLATFPLAVITRLTRSSMLEVLGADHVRVARANGLPERVVVLKYAFRTAMIPVITVIGLQFGALIAGAILTETVFGIPGLGRLTVTAIQARDYPIVRGAILFATVVFVLMNLGVDMLYGWIDPRQRVAS